MNMRLSVLGRSWQSFSVEDLIVNILGNVDHLVCHTPHLWHCSVQAAADDILNEAGCVPIKLYLQKWQQARLGPWAVVDPWT